MGEEECALELKNRSRNCCSGLWKPIKTYTFPLHRMDSSFTFVSVKAVGRNWVCFLYCILSPGKTWEGDIYSTTSWGRGKKRCSHFVVGLEVKSSVRKHLRWSESFQCNSIYLEKDFYKLKTISTVFSGGDYFQVSVCKFVTEGFFLMELYLRAGNPMGMPLLGIFLMTFCCNRHSQLFSRSKERCFENHFPPLLPGKQCSRMCLGETSHFSGGRQRWCHLDEAKTHSHSPVLQLILF